jgi:hypothetical protein
MQATPCGPRHPPGAGRVGRVRGPRATGQLGNWATGQLGNWATGRTYPEPDNPSQTARGLGSQAMATQAKVQPRPGGPGQAGQARRDRPGRRGQAGKVSLVSQVPQGPPSRHGPTLAEPRGSGDLGRAGTADGPGQVAEPPCARRAMGVPDQVSRPSQTTGPCGPNPTAEPSGPGQPGRAPSEPRRAPAQ